MIIEQVLCCQIILQKSENVSGRGPYKGVRGEGKYEGQKVTEKSAMTNLRGDVGIMFTVAVHVVGVDVVAGRGVIIGDLETDSRVIVSYHISVTVA